MSLAEKLINMASPTLAGYKIGNLMNLSRDICSSSEICSLRKKLLTAGLDIKLIRKNKNRLLILIFNIKALDSRLKESEIRDFLKNYGYVNCSLEGSLCLLADHFTEAGSFPHEIGVFLGYPLADVCAFIKNAGKNEKYCGYWKVYNDVEESKKVFEKFDACINCLRKRYLQGESFECLLGLT